MVKRSVKEIVVTIVLIIALTIITTNSLITWLYKQNNEIVITEEKYVNNKIPNNFNGYRIMQISDLHNKEFGENQEDLINKTKQIKPDIIVITGDLIDKRLINIEVAMEYVNEAVKIAPIYYVSGNHEFSSRKYKDFIKILKESNVNVLESEQVELQKDGESIGLLGIKDFLFFMDEEAFSNKIDELIEENNSKFKILLSHRPEYLDVYSSKKIDLVFSGHAHGGQVNIPLIGPIVAPGQGLFPKYVNGKYEQEDTTLMVSRGLGNSSFPQRINNKPQIIVVTLQNK